MHLEMEQACPLCKRRLPKSPAPHELGTRLCDECQGMVHSALRARSTTGAAAATVTPQSEVTAEIELREDQFNWSDEGSRAASSFDAQSQSSSFFEADDELDAFELESLGARHIAPSADDESTNPPEGVSQLIADSNEDPLEEQEIAQAETESTGSLEEFRLDSLTASAVPPEGHVEDNEPLVAEASADPWEDPLPTWDYSQNEWPVLVGPKHQSSRKKLGLVFLALGLAVLAVAAVSYSLIHRSQKRPPVTTDSSASERETATAEARSSEMTGAQNDAPPSPAADPPAVQIASREADNSAGRYALQAAAFPNQDGAYELAENLKRAGVPSYVVSADIPRRGRWFRVRVGRFDSAADAQRYAGEAVMRAGAAGLALQLIVCQYQPPE